MAKLAAMLADFSNGEASRFVPPAAVVQAGSPRSGTPSPEHALQQPVMPPLTIPVGPFDVLRRHAIGAGETIVGLVRADAGWGKTFTLERAADFAAADGWLVIRAECTPARTGSDAVASWLTQLDRALIGIASDVPGRLSWSAVADRALHWAHAVERADTGSRPDPPERQRLGAAELGDVIVELVELAGPTMLLLDDVHLADDELVELIEGLTGRPAVAVVGVAGRLDGPNADDLCATSVAVGVLDDAALTGLAERSLGRLPSDDERALLAALSGRHPLLVVEAANALARGESADRSTVTDLARRRMDRMDPADRATLEMLAVGGLACWPELLGESVPRLVCELVVDEVLECRMQSRIVGATEFRFVHSAVRDAIDSAVPHGRRVAAHADLARRLLDAAPADIVAPHAVAAALGGVSDLKEPAVTLSCRAAQHALDDWATDRAARHVGAARSVVEVGRGDAQANLDELTLLDARIHLIRGRP